MRPIRFDSRTYVSDTLAVAAEVEGMKREDLIRDLRRYARKNNLDFAVLKDRGAGSHYMVKLGHEVTIIQSGELSPLKVRRICNQLKVDPALL